MSVSYCIAARGHPFMLQRSAALTWSLARRPDTRVVIAVDDDDPETVAAAERVQRHAGEKVLVSVAPREDTLGAKYNRAAAAHPADLYVIGCDDTACGTEGWDVRLDEAWRRFPEGIGVVYFGDVENVFQGGQAVTHRLTELLGYFIPPYFPTWWHDRWIDEIAQMIGRIGRASVELRLFGPVGRTRALRDVNWWAAFYDMTRVDRRAAAEIIACGLAESTARKQELLDAIPYLCLDFYAKCAHFRDPITAARFEREMGYDAPDDERYRRAKAAAGAMATVIAQRVRKAS